MSRMGIAHKPGMAADLMKQLAPLLAEDGIDLDDLGGTDHEAFASALDRATEQHNLALFTPVGRHRALSLAVLRMFTTAIADDDPPLAQAVLDGVPRDETDEMPAGSHVIGAALGLLDTWLSDRAFASVRPRMRVPAWPDRAATAVARDIVPLANKGRAFDSLNSLILRHGGKSVMDGAALAVAAAIIAEAQAKGTPVSEVVELVLPGDGSVAVRTATPDGAKPASGAAFRRTTRGQGSDAALTREFTTWLREDRDGESAEQLEKAGELFELLLDIAGEAHLDVRKPGDIAPLIDELYEMFEDAPEQVLETFLFTLDDYLHFQLAVSTHPDAWDEPHTTLERELDSGADLSGLLRDALTHGAEIDADVQYAALLRLPVVSAVRPLLEWMGDSRAITPSGSLRRADIAEVAAMIGIDAAGVAKRTAQRSDAPVQVTSMLELTVLAAWWEALQLADVIALTSTRVRPGSKASEWSLGADPTYETVEMLAGMVAAQILTDNYFNPDDEQEGRMISAVVPLALAALREEGLAEPELSFDDALTYVAGARVARLREVGLAESPKRGVIAVPDALVGTVSRAVMTLLAMQLGMPPGPDEPSGGLPFDSE